MELSLTVCGKKASLKDSEFVNTRTEVVLMETGRKDNLMDWVRKFYQMVLYLMGGGLTAKQEVMAKRFYQMEPFSKVSGKKASS